MVFSNAQSQTSPAGGSQKNSQPESLGYQSSAARPVSSKLGYQQIRSRGNDSEGRNVLCGSGGSITGGTIKQLIAETLEELQESESRSDKLRKRLVQLSNLLESVDSTSEASSSEE